MLQAVYKTSPYIFRLQTQDVSQVTVTATLTSAGLTAAYLFKFTNQMDGGVKYAWGMFSESQLNPLVYSKQWKRYISFYMFHNTTDNINTSDINFVPNGHWDYEITEYSVDVDDLATTQNMYNQVPDLDSGFIGSYKIYQTSDATVIKASGDLYLSDLSDASSADELVTTLPSSVTALNAESYTAALYRKDGDTQQSVNFTISTYNFGVSGASSAPLALNNIKQTATGMSFDVVCTDVQGWTYKYRQGTGGYTTVSIALDSQTDSYSFAQVGDYNAASNKIEVILVSDGSYVPDPNADQYSTILYPIATVLQSYGFIHPIAYQPAITGDYSRSGGVWYCVVPGYDLSGTGKSRNIYQKGKVNLNGLLYVDEPSGEEEVQYTEYKNASLGGFIINYVGVGYASAPTVTISGGGGSGATATATVSGGILTKITVTAGGSGYTSAPNVILTGGGATTQAEVLATLQETNYIYYN
tara:strand:+ start:2580 stop:3992 length:1413 start_codon:yes stop_codon:yes gene_type:complete